MGMMINEAMTNLENLQKDYQDFHDEVWRDPETYSINAESLKIAINTMRKYQKIEQIIDNWTKPEEIEWKIREVIENGNNT